MKTDTTIKDLKARSPVLFDELAGRYDFLNRLLSLGRDNAWRRAMLRHLPDGESLQVLDIGAGTARVAVALAQGSSRVVSVTGIDLAPRMLEIGRQRIKRAGLEGRIVLKIEDAQKLSFPDNTFDLVTAGFALRNMPDIMRALAESYRVLRKGGKIIILELSRPQAPFIREGHAFYLSFVMPSIGFLFSADKRAYQYLGRTGLAFPSGDRFCRIIRQAGFLKVVQQELFLGAMSIYAAEK